MKAFGARKVRVVLGAVVSIALLATLGLYAQRRTRHFDLPGPYARGLTRIATVADAVGIASVSGWCARRAHLAEESYINAALASGSVAGILFQEPRSLGNDLLPVQLAVFARTGGIHLHVLRVLRSQPNVITGYLAVVSPRDVDAVRAFLFSTAGSNAVLRHK
jgi:hypothetical protein